MSGCSQFAFSPSLFAPLCAVVNASDGTILTNLYDGKISAHVAAGSSFTFGIRGADRNGMSKVVNSNDVVVMIQSATALQNQCVTLSLMGSKVWQPISNITTFTKGQFTPTGAGIYQVRCYREG